MRTSYFDKRRRDFEMSAPTIQHLIGDAANFNSGGMAFVINQLAFVETTVYERKFAPLLYQKLVTISTEGGPGVTSFVYKTMDGVGQGKRIANCADDIPYVDFAMGAQVVPVVLGGVGYHYQTEELRQAAMLNIPLVATKARLAFRAYENHMNKVAIIGENKDLFGLCNNPQIPVIEAPARMDVTGTQYQDVMAVLNGAMSAVYAATAMNTFANTILIPPSIWENWISIYQPYQGVPLTEMITEYNFTTISGGGAPLLMQVPELETAGQLPAPGSRRIVVYNRDADNVVMHIPMPLTFLPPQAEDLDLKIPGEYKYSGVEVRYLGTMRYIDGV